MDEMKPLPIPDLRSPQYGQFENKSTASLIAQQIEVLLSAYRKDDYADPQGFVAQLGMILSEFPAEVIIYATSPQTGIQRESKWPPTIQEVLAYCQEYQRHLEVMRRPTRKVLPPPKEPELKPGRISWRGHNLETYGRPIGRFEKPGDEWNRSSRPIEEQAAE